MLKKWKESEFFKKMKQVRVNRVIYLSAIVILLSLAVVLAITAATNRAKRNPSGEDTTPSVTEPATLPPVDTDEGSRPTVKDEVPSELALPASGKLSEIHSVDVQVFSDTMQDWRVHLGIDIATEENAQVFAAADGSVAQIWEDPMMGTCIALSHSGECVTVYKNLASEMAAGIEIGAEVKAGQLIGTVGGTAMLELAEEPHLHMEMTVKGLQVDPLEYFSAAVIKPLSEDTVYEDSAIGK